MVELIGTAQDRPGRVGQACPLCGAETWAYLFERHGVAIQRCAACGLARADADRRTDSGVLGQVDDPATHYVDVSSSPTEREAAERYARSLEYDGTRASAMLVVAPTGHPFAEVARRRGHRVEACLNFRELEAAAPADGRYDAAVVVFQLEKANDPSRFLERLHAALADGAKLLLVTPSLDSWSARFFRDQWTEWRTENAYYFDVQTAQGLLLRAGFDQIRSSPDVRRYSLQHVYDRARGFPRSALTRSIRLLAPLVPAPLSSRVRVNVSSSGMVVTARRAERRARPLLSIVMPVYNERNSFRTAIDAVLGKELAELDREVIVVESNSRDGTREVVRQYQDHPDVKVVLQRKPMGKGNAVRQGLAHAEGDFVLIQDADQEYDVNDYDSLLTPLFRYEKAFVLGSRHVGSWKMREFNDQPVIAGIFNLGHVVFQMLLNVLYGQSLRDPFTMYKVFRRDCLHGLRLECNRFDFDFELVIKLIRKGYKPVEIPVNYRARSFREGKKVSAVRDPLTWIRALFKYRVTSIYEDAGR